MILTGQRKNGIEVYGDMDENWIDFTVVPTNKSAEEMNDIEDKIVDILWNWFDDPEDLCVTDYIKWALNEQGITVDIAFNEEEQ